MTRRPEVENDKTSFLHKLFKALGAEDHDTNSPPGEGAENIVLDDLTHIGSHRGYFPQKTPRASFSVGDPPLALAKSCVGSACKAVQDGPQRLLELLQEIGYFL
jgi:hypothetical protein